MPTEKALIVLQENGTRIPLPDALPDALKQLVYGIIDSLSERFEDLKTQLQAAGRYKVVDLLTDNACKRARLLDALVDHTKKSRIIDLVVLGHGSPESLLLKGETLTGRTTGNLRKLLPDAKKKGVDRFNLRMVYMCNCYGSTLNDDWLSIGAKASVGSIQNDMMPEPMTTFFLRKWLNGMKIGKAAREAYEQTVPYYLLVYPPTVRVRTKRVKVPFPCPTLSNPFKMCENIVEIPDGVETTPHSNVKQTELVVGGDANLAF